MRFVAGLAIDQRARANLFAVTARLDRAGQVVSQALGQ